MGLNINKEIKELYQEGLFLRRELHRIPELGFQEEKTSHFLVRYLEDLNLEVKKGIAGTGVIAFIPGTKGERTLAFRADIDALPVHERVDCDYTSNHEGRMHACGHDGHMAALLLFAKHLSARRDRISHNILLIFQPAEEGPGGALPMIKEGILENYHVDAIFGMHIFPSIQQGKVGCCPGPMMAQNGEFDLLIQGKSSHGARPHEGKDSIWIAAQVISSLQGVISRQIDPIQGKLLSIGTIKGGEVRNVIAKEVLLEGTIRAFREEIYSEIKDGIKRVSQGIEKMHHCNIDLKIRDLYPSVTNDEGLFRMLQNIVPRESLEVISPLMISEDFSYYQRKVPGLFFLLGAQNNHAGFIHSLHSDQFNFDEEILLTAVQIYAEIVENYPPREMKRYVNEGGEA